MAWYDATGNRGYNYYGGAEPAGYGGRKHAVYGYSAASERYTATTEEVVGYGGYPAPHSPTRNKLYNKVRGVGENPFLPPWSSTQDRPNKGGKSSPKFSKTTGSPPNYVPSHGSPPPRDHYGKPKNNQFSSDDDTDSEEDVICENGFCYPKPKPNINEGDREREKHKEKGYAPGNYAAPNSTHQPKKPSYPATSYPDNYHERPKGDHTVTVPTQPRQDPYYDTQKKRPVANNPPPPIRTKPDPSRGRVEYFGGNTSDSPVSAGAQRSPFASSSPAPGGANRSPFTSSPRKDNDRYRETIDSAEARRRYGRASAGAEARPDDKHTGTISCEEAARKYNGVLVNY